MKKILGLLLAALLIGTLWLSVCAMVDVVYVDWSAKDDASSGFAIDAAKKTPGGAAEALPDGGIILVTGKAYINKSLTFPKTNGPITFTSVYGGRDYKNPEPANNPKCAFKMSSGAKWTIESEVIFDDIILFQENGQNTLVVADGGVLTVNESVVSMSNHAYYWNIVVEKGGKATINGGIFSNVGGEGEIVIGEGATILEGEHAEVLPNDGDPEVVFQKYGGKNENSGLTPEQPKGSLGKLDDTGAIGLLPRGGTIVGVGKLYLGNSYTLPNLGGPLTFTSVYGGVDYKDPEPAHNPNCAFKLASGATFTIQSDVVFDDIILFQENNQNTIKVTNCATLIVTDKVVFMSNHDYHYKLVLEEGTVAILSAEAQKKFTVEGSGDVILYGDSAPVQTVVKMVIGEEQAYVNGRGKTLDAAPLIRNDRTMLPVRFVAENLGAVVGWDGATRTVKVITDTVTLEIGIGNEIAKINGAEIKLDSPAFIENDRTYLPVRFVAENLGAVVGWDSVTYTVTLTK